MNRFLLLYEPKAATCIVRLYWCCIIILISFLLITPAYSQDVLWGMTSSIGPKGGGTIFSLKSNGTDFTVHNAFSMEPHNPTSLIKSSNGFFYGMTSAGGINNVGTIFKIAPDGTGFSVLNNFFNYSQDGAVPTVSLLKSSNGFSMV